MLSPLLLVVCVAACDGGNGISLDFKAPTVSSVTPANGALNVAVSMSINAKFSEAMEESTINTSTFILMGTGGGVTGAVSYDSNSNTASFAPSGDLAYDTLYTATIITGVRDAAGNNLASDYHWSFTTEPEPPTLSYISPADGASGIPLDTNITAVFDQAMDCASIEAPGTFMLNPAVIAQVACANDTAVLTPENPLTPGTDYTATISTAAKSSSGAALESPYQWSFSTIGKVNVTWNANRESAVNSLGGGYRVYYSTSSDFNPGDADVSEINVPYVSGNAAPTSANITLPSGTYYFRVAAYSALTPPGGNGESVSELSAEVSVTVP